ncbi:hypothetical protein Csa_023772, partial [Cucumis sativus]
TLSNFLINRLHAHERRRTAPALALGYALLAACQARPRAAGIAPINAPRPRIPAPKALCHATQGRSTRRAVLLHPVPDAVGAHLALRWATHRQPDGGHQNHHLRDL